MTPKEFLARFVRVYGKPYHDDQGDVIELLARQLAEFEPDVLRRASDAIVLSRAKQTWPMPVEILTACRAEAEKLRAERNWEQAGKPEHKRDEWSDVAIREADRMILCDLGYEAAQDGWVLPLHDHLRQTGAYPDAGEMSKLKRAGLRLTNTKAKARKISVTAKIADAIESRERPIIQRVEHWAEAQVIRNHPLAAG